MKYIQLIAITALLTVCRAHDGQVMSQDLIMIEQDYEKAMHIASKEDKILFIDFYTTWCGPCKKLDRLVFQNDSIQQLLGEEFILLRYDAENDTVFHLSKKHHVSSYPTGLIVNNKGYVVNRKYGFRGEDFQSLSKNVLEFANEGIKLNSENKILKGYSNQIDISKYPKFYVDYVNRTDTKMNPSELNKYLSDKKAIFSEEYFSVLIYFARDVSDSLADTILKNKNKYLDLYGNLDVEILLYFLTSGKFERAISEVSQLKYDSAVVFAKSALSEDWTVTMLPSFEIDLLKAQNKWGEVFSRYEKQKNNGDFDNEYQ